jgi:hypothetical protein
MSVSEIDPVVDGTARADGDVDLRPFESFSK